MAPMPRPTQVTLPAEVPADIHWLPLAADVVGVWLVLMLVAMTTLGLLRGRAPG
jgi:hypothetical protein